MFLAIDVGNTQTVIGIFDGERLTRQWRLTSQGLRTADECALLVGSLLRDAAVNPRLIGRMALASVVPSLTPAFREMGERLFAAAPLIIDGRLDTGVPLLVDDPTSVGADRIVNVVAARTRHGCPAIVVDLGTANTFDVLDKGGNYLGGAIAPGIGISAEALFVRGARLARVELKPPASAIGRTTEEHLQAGIFFGAVGQIDEIVNRIIAEIGGSPVVVATGGLSQAIGAHSKTIRIVDPDLTLHGIRLVDERVSGRGGI